MSDFKWNGEDAKAIVLGWQPRTAVYQSDNGTIVIRQEADGYVDEHDDLVYLTPMGALQIAWRLIEVAHEAGVPEPNRNLMAKPLDVGPSEPPAPLLEAMREAGQ